MTDCCCDTKLQLCLIALRGRPGKPHYIPLPSPCLGSLSIHFQHTTARYAFNRGWETWLNSDACGSANKKQLEADLRGFDFACGNVITTAEAIAKLKESEP